MKKLTIILLIMFIFLGIKTNVLAFTGNYNYDITSLSKDEEGNVKITGWAIPNAGVNDGQSPSLNKNRGSGFNSGKCVTNNRNNYYTYTLYLVPVDEKGNPINSDAIEIGAKKGSGTSLTNIMCYKSGSKCVDSRSSCYENVGFTFSFNESVIKNTKFKNGYFLRLKIVASGDNYSVSFPLVVYSSRITGFGSDYKYQNQGQAGVNLRVKVIAFDGYFRTCSASGTCQRKNNNKFPHDKIYNVLGVVNNKSENLTYYKVGNDSLYIPASWVAPPDTDMLILPPAGPKDVKSCSNNNTGQTPTNKEVKACNGNLSFSGDNYASCSVDAYTYFTKKCTEKNYKVNFSINDIKDNSTNFNITNGAGITANANVSTELTCSYTFKVQEFKKDYNDVLYNLDYYEKESPDWYINYNIKTNLDNILKNYLSQTDATNWNSNYKFSELNAILKVDNKETPLEKRELVHETIDLNNDNKKENKYCLVSKSEKFNLNGTNYNINTDITCGEAWKLDLELPEVCLNMKTGEPESCVNGSNTTINGGRKYYIDMEKTSGNIELVLSNLGYDKAWSATLKNCNYNVPKMLDNIKFRQIDIRDPFLISYDRDRLVGVNYLNDKYSFVDIIHDDIWENSDNFDYAYSMSKTNVNNIRKDTNEDKAGSYLGRNCYIDSSNKYICDFTRNKNETGVYNKTTWFTDFVVNKYTTND